MNSKAKKEAFEFLNDIAQDVENAKDKTKDWMKTAMRCHLRMYFRRKGYEASAATINMLVDQWAGILQEK